ncbi:hypothetical protein JVU11DRAFT_6451 [Chiua virens]|nr:hypothetical protein JVU11DRAFT_6451 [Chiua virens]
MGLFKKFFSIGSRKFKKRSAVDPCTVSSPPVQDYLKPSQEDDTEAEVSRLLRSSSGRCAAEPQFGLNSLPPLPHPTDSVIRHPKSSSTTIASVSVRSTYSVTIRSRTVHSRTEFPNAYPPMDVSCTPKRSLTDPGRRRSKSVPITPRDKNRLLLLRQDPSVASLLNHYDDGGHLNSALFSNTPSPQKDGRVQRRRAGSTLRQLLGHPSSSDSRSGTEGDISWAEKLIGETDCNSSISSLGPRTPVDTHFPHTHSTDDKTALSITECDTSAANQQTFSSLEVELSISTDLAHSRTLDSPLGKSMTPQRASQVFGFLGDKKRAHDSPVSRLPQPKTTTPHFRRFSAESSISDTKNSHIPLRRSCTYIPQPTTPSSPLRFSPPAATIILPSYPMDEGFSPLQDVVSQHTGQSSPRGPRPTSGIISRQSVGLPCDDDDTHAVTKCPLSIQSVLDEKPNADNEYISVSTVRPREVHSQIPKLRSTSGSSSSSTESRHNPAISSPRQHVVPLQPTVQINPREADFAMIDPVYGKGSETPSRLPQPVTPARPFGYHLREPPSPTSSSELSPVAKQMMANLREQRMQARQQERQAGRLGSGHSRIRS